MKRYPMNKKLTSLLLAGITLILALESAAQPGSGTPPKEPKKLPKDAAAMVNGEIIPMQKVYDTLFRQYGQGMLDQMIKATLAKQEAKRLGVTINKEEVDKKVDEWKSNFLGRFNNDEKAANEMLSRQGATLASTLAFMREYHSTENLWAQLVRHNRKPDYKSLKESFEQKYGKNGEKFEVAHIVLTTNLTDEKFANRYPEKKHYLNIDRIEKDAEEQAMKVAARVRGGEDFAKLAKEFSDDWSKQNGGKLGEFWKNRFGKAFEDAITNGSIGDNVGPIKTKDGFLVAKIESAEFDTAYSARQIFLAFAGKDRDKVIDSADKLKEKLNKGADFAALARAESQDPLTRENGGLWEPFKADEKIQQISNAIQALEPGGISDPILTPYGVHLIQLVKKTQTPKGEKKGVSIIQISTQYAKVKDKVLKPMIEKEMREKAESLIKRLKAGADFASLAREHSDEKYTGQRGGVITGYASHRVSPEFHALIKTMKPGELAPEPILTHHGYHVVKLIRRYNTTFEKVKDDLFKEEQKRAPGPMEIQRLQDKLMNLAEITKRK